MSVCIALSVVLCSSDPIPSPTRNELSYKSEKAPEANSFKILLHTTYLTVRLHIIDLSQIRRHVKVIHKTQLIHHILFIRTVIYCIVIYNEQYIVYALILILSLIQ